MFVDDADRDNDDEVVVDDVDDHGGDRRHWLLGHARMHFWPVSKCFL